MYDLREFQRAALNALEKPGHVICVAPTGSGKSLIYEKMAQKGRFRMLLVTPLVALARQQFRNLGVVTDSVVLGIGAGIVGGAGGESREPPVGRSGVWIVSPEALQCPVRQASLAEWSPDFLVVDECHCMWEWGESFRPAFAELPDLIRRLGITRSLWLTATLPQDARAKLRERLPDNPIEIGGFALPSHLSLELIRSPWPERPGALVSTVHAQHSAGIVFVATREGTLRVTRLLQESGLEAVPYHAGMALEERLAVESAITRQQPDVVVATTAFGMGMNHPHLRWVALWQAPLSLLGLAQAVGRAGRLAHVSAKAVVFWDDEDFRMLEWAVIGSERRKRELENVFNFVHANVCRAQALVAYFEGEGRTAISHAIGRCGKCDICKTIPDMTNCVVTSPLPLDPPSGCVISTA